MARSSTRPHPNSILANLEKLPEALKAKFFKNRKQAEGDTAAMERWAAGGYQSGGEVDANPDWNPESIIESGEDWMDDADDPEEM